MPEIKLEVRQKMVEKYSPDTIVICGSEKFITCDQFKKIKVAADNLAIETGLKIMVTCFNVV